jgi:ATP-binding cassette subfamily B multidrug efflux pump
VSPRRHDDDPVGKSYDWTLLRRLLAYLRPYKRAVALAFLLIIVMSGLDLVGPYVTKIAIDRHIARGDVRGLAGLAAFYVLVLLAAFGVRFAQTYVLQMTGQRVMRDLRAEIFGHLQRLHIGYFDRNPVGRLVTRATSDVDAINELFTSGLVTVFGDLFSLFGIMAVMLAMSARLALVTFAVIPLFFLVTIWFRRGARSSFREVRRWLARISAFLQEHLSGMSVVQLFSREESTRAGFAAVNRGHADANVKQIFYYAVFYPAIEILAAVTIALILVYGGGRVMVGTLTIGVLVAFLQYSERFWRPISDLSEKFNVLQAAMAAAERIFLLIDTRPQIESRPGARPLPAGPGRIVFADVSFAYDAEQLILRDISFALEPGRSVALVGATGAGKTTIISLLTRFYEITRGRITCDDVDIRDLDLAAWRASLAIVLQDPHLFSGTIA